MSSLVQRIGRRKPGGSGTDYSNLFPGPALWRFCIRKSVGIAVFNNAQLILLGADRLPVETAGTGRLTESRADPACKLRERISLLKPLKCLVPVSGIKQVGLLRHQVIQRTPGRHAAKHQS